MRRAPELDERIGIELYHYIIHHEDRSAEIRDLYNKVASMLDQLHVLSGE